MDIITDDEIKEDIWKTLKMWDRFNALEEEQQQSLAEYLFHTYGHLYKEDKVQIEKSQ